MLSICCGFIADLLYNELQANRQQSTTNGNKWGLSLLVQHGLNHSASLAAIKRRKPCYKTNDCSNILTNAG